MDAALLPAHLPQGLETVLLHPNVCGTMQEEGDGKLQSIGCLVMADDGARVTLNPAWLDYLKVCKIMSMLHILVL